MFMTTTTTTMMMMNQPAFQRHRGPSRPAQRQACGAAHRAETSDREWVAYSCQWWASTRPMTTPVSSREPSATGRVGGRRVRRGAVSLPGGRCRRPGAAQRCRRPRAPWCRSPACQRSRRVPDRRRRLRRSRVPTYSSSSRPARENAKTKSHNTCIAPQAA